MVAPIVSKQSLQSFARNSKLLSLLDERGLERLAAGAFPERFAAGVTIVRQGDMGGSFYLITAGEVRVMVAEAGDKEVARLGPGMFFGEMSVVTRQPRSATVQTTLPTQVLRFEREPVMAILKDYPKVREFLGTVGLARTEENINHMLGADGGLADLLEGEEPPLSGGLSEALEGDEPELSVEDGEEEDPLGVGKRHGRG